MNLPTPVDIPFAVEVSLLIALFIFQVWSIAKVFSYTDAKLLLKYRFYGPLAYLIPGVLKRGGTRFLWAFLIATAAILCFWYLFASRG